MRAWHAWGVSLLPTKHQAATINNHVGCPTPAEDSREMSHGIVRPPSLLCLCGLTRTSVRIVQPRFAEPRGPVAGHQERGGSARRADWRREEEADNKHNPVHRLPPFARDQCVVLFEMPAEKRTSFSCMVLKTSALICAKTGAVR